MRNKKRIIFFIVFLATGFTAILLLTSIEWKKTISSKTSNRWFDAIHSMNSREWLDDPNDLENDLGNDSEKELELLKAPIPSPSAPTDTSDIPSTQDSSIDASASSPIELSKKEALYLLPSYTTVEIEELENPKRDGFGIYEIDTFLYHRIYGISYKENKYISLEDLRYLRVLHYDKNEVLHIGELIVNKEITQDIIDIFYELYLVKYPIEKMILIDDYNGDDNLSMEDNNTSAFNYRTMVGSNNISKHSLGLAIDINPLYNPYVKKTSASTIILPAQGSIYVNREESHPYIIKKNDPCYEAFTKRGFTWGGSWNSLKDYQHFERNK